MATDTHYKESYTGDYHISNHTDIGWNMKDFHFHEHYEIFLCMTDGITTIVNDKIYNTNKGDLVIFNDMDLHKNIAPADMPYFRYIIHFKPEFINSFSQPDVDLTDCFINRPVDFSNHIHLNDEQLSYLIDLFDKSLEHWSNPTYASNLYSKLYLAEILLYINQLYASQPLVTSKVTRDFIRIQPIIQFINSNYTKQLSVEDIANKFYMSSHHIEWLFKNATGLGIKKYIIKKRVLKARELLRTNMPVSQVSEEVGFNDLSHFIRTFKSLVGVSPKQYAKQHETNQIVVNGENKTAG